MKLKLKLGLVIFIFGFLGVLSIVLMDIPLPIPDETKEEIFSFLSPLQLKLLMLINPTILLAFFTILGVSFYNKVNFKVPFFENITWKKNQNIDYKNILKNGTLGGFLGGILIVIVVLLFQNHIPEELNDFKAPVLTRFLYGGITEEILIRFGLMSFVVWVLSLFFGIKKWVYWFGILFTSFIFGIAHLPIVLILTESPTSYLITYIILGNSVAGIVFGWLYWKKNLETAIIAHIFTHIVLIIFEKILM